MTRKVGRPRRTVDRKLLRPSVTGTPIYYRNSRGGAWRMQDVDLLFALDMYAEGEKIQDIIDYFGISSYTLYKNIGPYLERR
jgi:hypothetical protein